MKYIIIIIAKVLLMAWYCIAQMFNLLFSLKFKPYSFKEVWLNAYSEFGFDPMVSPNPRCCIFPYFFNERWTGLLGGDFIDVQAVARGDESQHFL